MNSPIQVGASTAGPSKRKSKGRQKVSMTKMKNESNLQVTFSKRRAGLFKKASELFTLCGVEGAIIVFSPGNKVYSFGHPNVKTVTDWLVNGVPSALNGGKSINQMIVDAQRNSNIRALSMELTDLDNMLGTAKKRGNELDRTKKEGQGKNWYPPPIEEFNKEGLMALNQTIKNFKEHLDNHVAELSMLVTQSGYGNGSGVNINNVYQTPNNPQLAMTSNNNAMASYELFRGNGTHIPLDLNDCNVDPYHMMVGGSTTDMLFTGSGSSMMAGGGSTSDMLFTGNGVSTSSTGLMLPNGTRNNFAAGEFYGFKKFGAEF